MVYHIRTNKSKEKTGIATYKIIILKWQCKLYQLFLEKKDQNNTEYLIATKGLQDDLCHSN
jgi:hypothetical protein